MGQGEGGLGQKIIFMKYYSGLKLQVLESSKHFTELNNIKFTRLYSHLKLPSYRFFSHYSYISLYNIIDKSSGVKKMKNDYKN